MNTPSDYTLSALRKEANTMVRTIKKRLRFQEAHVKDVSIRIIGERVQLRVYYAYLTKDGIPGTEIATEAL